MTTLLTAKDFLEFAKNDIKEGGNRGMVNAVSNLKKAVHCQVGKILIHFEQENMLKRHFPQKFELTQKLSIDSPDSLRRLTNLRNMLEHEYVLPTIEDIELWWDLVQQYLLRTDDLLLHTPKYSRPWQQRIDQALERVGNLQVERNVGTVGLESYPAFFFGDNMETDIVVGRQATEEEVLGAIEIAAGLQGALPNAQSVYHGCLDDEIPNFERHIVSVGNPDSNSVSAYLLKDYPIKFEQNMAKIILLKLPKDYHAVIIVGNKPVDIRRAAKVLTNYREYALMGNEITVRGTALSELNIQLQYRDG